MSNAILQGGASGTGNMTLLAPNTNSNRTVTFPDVDGQAMVSGNVPAFRAHRVGTQSISHNTHTKVQFENESYDTNNCYDSTTNYRFTPNVAGYYKVTLSVSLSSVSANSFCAIQKNGSFVGFSPVGFGWTGIANTESLITADFYMNGTTDYLEGFVYQASGGDLNISTDPAVTYFSAFMFRGA